MLNDLANTTQNQLDFNIVAEKRSANNDIIQNISVCFFPFFVSSFSLSLSHSHCLDSKYL